MGVNSQGLKPEETNVTVRTTLYQVGIDDYNNKNYDEEVYTTIETSTFGVKTASELPTENKFDADKRNGNCYGSNDTIRSAENYEESLEGLQIGHDHTTDVTETGRTGNVSPITLENKEAESAKTNNLPSESECRTDIYRVDKDIILSSDNSQNKESTSVKSNGKSKEKNRFKTSQKVSRRKIKSKEKKVRNFEKVQVDIKFDISCRFLMVAVLSIIFPVATGKDNTNSIVLTLASDSVFVNGDMTMVCTIPDGLLKRNSISMSWQRRRSGRFEVIGIGEFPSNESKYSLQIQRSDQRLYYYIKVFNVDAEDIVTIYKCNIGFISCERNVSSLMKAFKYVPKNDDIPLSTKCLNGKWEFNLMIPKILPKPENFSMDFQGRKINGVVDIVPQNSLFYNGTVTFKAIANSAEICGYVNISYRISNLSVLISKDCNQICKREVSPFPKIAIVALFLLTLAVMFVVKYCHKKKRKSERLEALKDSGKALISSNKDKIPTENESRA